MLQMKNWQTGNKKVKIMTKIAYSERLALEGQQEFNTWFDDTAPNSALKQPNLYDWNTCQQSAEKQQKLC